MVDKNTDNSILTIIDSKNTGRASDALFNSAVPFSVTPESESDKVQLILSINSAEVPLVTSIYFEIDGVKQVDYYLQNEGTGERLAPDSQTPATGDYIVSRTFSSPVSANELVITLTAASADTLIQLSNLKIKACISPGK